MAANAKERVNAPVAEVSEHVGLISNEKLRLLYATMLKCRTMEEQIVALFQQGRLTGNYYAGLGQEATTVGTAIDLRAEDTIGSSNRDFITLLIKGAPLDQIFCSLYARADSPETKRSTPAHSGCASVNRITPPAPQLDVATGVALANKMKKNDSIVMAYSESGSASTASWHQALNFASVQGLPIVFVCQNSLPAEAVNRQPHAGVSAISVIAQAYEVPEITVDGNDVVAVYRVAQEAVARARRGQGPTLIDAKTFGRHGHSEIDPAKDRDPEEVEQWKATDPVLKMERYLMTKKLFTPESKVEILTNFERELNASVGIMEKSPLP